MSNTINDFWHMIWQESITYLVMITKLKENSKIQCDSYIPEDKYINVNYGDIYVCVVDIEEEHDYVVRKINIMVRLKSYFNLVFFKNYSLLLIIVQ
jgi:protein tyrosine phosphatase